MVLVWSTDYKDFKDGLRIPYGERIRLAFRNYDISDKHILVIYSFDELNRFNSSFEPVHLIV